ncbi:hypothetical protein KIN20_030664 [Parelaphostrongylus tenuis]|uniref:Uncharacterized protein n=1 Tax=Parelaphostrongylus tenuis TaxID=148309 RepID=A0AAD5R443_PARTN|nr:hypothetical protein KIN20_030664 [Parelaphostrongylus tenuis]
MRGLSMRQRLAPSLAIAFMSKVEAPAMDIRPLLYFLTKKTFGGFFLYCRKLLLKKSDISLLPRKKRKIDEVKKLDLISD